MIAFEQALPAACPALGFNIQPSQVPGLLNTPITLQHTSSEQSFASKTSNSHRQVVSKMAFISQ
jgi:hypothetical protein